MKPAGMRGADPAGAQRRRRRTVSGGRWRRAAPGRERGGPAGAGSAGSPGRRALAQSQWDREWAAQRGTAQLVS